jgi:hypothetical protein
VAAFFGFALAVIAIGGFIIRSVDAATWTGPTGTVPNGNVPGIIWNRLSSLATQTGASIDIDGGVTAQGMNIFGRNALALTGTQNLVYGVASSTSTASTSLLLLQTHNGTAAANRLRVDASGNLDASGKVRGSGCMGKVFVGLTTTGATAGYYRPGNVNGYYNADTNCRNQYGADAHVCRVEEIMESINCSAAGDPIRSAALNGNRGWINGGPPGFTAYATDCDSWTTHAVTNPPRYGRVWEFSSTTGGVGTLTACTTAGPTGNGLQFACCR